MPCQDLEAADQCSVVLVFVPENSRCVFVFSQEGPFQKLDRSAYGFLVFKSKSICSNPLAPSDLLVSDQPQLDYFIFIEFPNGVKMTPRRHQDPNQCLATGKRPIFSWRQSVGYQVPTSEQDPHPISTAKPS